MLTRWIALTLVAGACLSSPAFAAENEAPAAVAPSPSVAGTNRPDEASVQDMLRAYLHLQEQLHATQISVEQTRKESDELAAQNARLLSGRLQAIEQSLAAQRAKELDAMQNSNRVILILAGVFAALGFLAMLLMAYFQWRTVGRLAEITAALPMARALSAPGPVAALGTGDASLVSVSPTETLNARLLGAIEGLEKRIYGLEAQAPSAPVEEPKKHLGNGEKGTAEPRSEEAATPASLLTKGQALLNAEKHEEALACFEELLKIAPTHAEGLVKKGAALELLRRTNEAIECYDRAIAIDGSLTMAYLHKGGLFNRLERYGEALDCYEKALQNQEKSRAE